MVLNETYQSRPIALNDLYDHVNHMKDVTRRMVSFFHDIIVFHTTEYFVQQTTRVE